MKKSLILIEPLTKKQKQEYENAFDFNMMIKTKDFTLVLDDTPEARDKVFNAVLKFFLKQESFNGESIVQNDYVQIEAPEFLAELAEIFQFKVEWNEEE